MRTRDGRGDKIDNGPVIGLQGVKDLRDGVVIGPQGVKDLRGPAGRYLITGNNVARTPSLPATPATPKKKEHRFKIESADAPDRAWKPTRHHLSA